MIFFDFSSNKLNFKFMYFIFFVCSALMFFYPFFFFILSPCIVYLSCFKNDPEIYNKIDPAFFVGFVLVLIASLISFSTENVGDIVGYQSIINEIINNSSNANDNLKSIGIEFVMYSLIRVLSFLFGNDIEIVRFSVILIINSLFFLFLNKAFRIHSVFIFVLIQLSGFFTVAPYLMRQSLSIALFLLGLSFVDYKKRSTLILLSIFTHFSSLIYAFFLLFNKNIIGNKFYCVFFILIALFLSSVLNVSFILMTSEFMAKIPVLELFSYKLSGWDRFSDVGFNKFNFLNCLAICIAVLSYSPIENINSRIIGILFFSSILNLAFINVPIIYNRLGFLSYYFPLLFFITSFFEYNNFNKYGKVLLGIFYIIWFFELFRRIYGYSINGWLLLDNGDFYFRSLIYFINGI